MRKVIAAINMTLDGFCDHTAGIPDEEIHEHSNELLKNAGIVLYGRITYQLMEYWRTVVKNPTGNKAMDDFAVTMDNTPKLVFSHTLKHLAWKSATLATRSLPEEVAALKQQSGEGHIYWQPRFNCSFNQPSFNRRIPTLRSSGCGRKRFAIIQTPGRKDGSYPVKDKNL